MKPIKLLTTLALVSVVFVLFVRCKKDDYVPIVGVHPAVISTNPANDATGAPLNQAIAVTFNEVMNLSTITQASLTLEQAATSVAGIISYAGTTLFFTPTSTLIPYTTYTCTVAPTVKDYMGRVPCI